jgi:hypothetical protein
MKCDRGYTLNNENDVINLENDAENFFVGIPMFKLGDLLQNIKLKLLQVSQNDWQNNNWVIGKKQWLCEGKNCEILHLGLSSWKKGKIKINVTVEFYPDEPESPLDDIRQEINSSESK